MKLRSVKIAPMKFSQKWCVIVVLLIVFAATVSFFGAQTEESPTVNVSSSSEVQSESKDVQSRSDEPEQKLPTLASNDDTTPTDVEIDRRFIELRRELLDYREKTTDWWLNATAIFLTLLGVSAAILGYFGFKRLDRIESQARKNMEESEKHAEEAQRHLEDIRKSKDKFDSFTNGVSAEDQETNPDKASEVVEKVQQDPDPSPIDKLVARALLLQQQGKIGKAIDNWHAVALFAEESDNDLAANAWFSVGYLLNSKGEPDPNAAIDAYTKTLRLKPNSHEAYNNRGTVKTALGKHEEAVADYDEALRLRPDSPKLYNNRGMAKDNLGKHEEALADYDKAIRLKPDYAVAYNSRGIAQGNLGQYEAALVDFDKAIRLKPNNAEAFFNRGLAKRKLLRMDEARKDFEMTLHLALSTNNAKLIEQVRREIEDLGRGDN